MKKIYAIIVVLILLSCMAFVAVATDINKERNAVQITEKILYGDKSVANGLEIKTVNQLDYRLYWETDYKIGKNPKTKTDFSFHTKQYFGEPNRSKREGIWMTDVIEYGFYENVPASEQVGIQKAYKELYDSAQIGEEKTKKVYLKDYYNYYPIGVNFDLPHTQWVPYDSTLEKIEGVPYDSKYVCEKFSEYFKIPVLDSDYVTISVGRMKDGNSYSTGLEETGSLEVYATATVSESKNRCFFVINNCKVNENDIVEYYDTSLIPGGYGIYSFYYCGGDSASRTGILADRIETVFQLEKEVRVSHITLSEDESQLLLFTLEQEEFYLTVIDVDTMAVLQKILISSGKGIGNVFEHDNFIVTDTDDFISVISVENNIYSLDYTVRKASFINEKFQDIWNADSMDYKNGKLVVVGNAFDDDGREKCDFFVSVYGKTGLLYYGVYDNSLDYGEIRGQYSQNCHPADINPNTVKWN